VTSWQNEVGAVPLNRPGNTGLLSGYCTVFGDPDQGPKGLVGGLYGPEHNGDIHWYCKNHSIGRFRMTCRCGHRGQVMNVCADHAGPDGISKRMAGMCPPCAYPPEAAELDTESRVISTQLGLVPPWESLGSLAIRLRRRQEDIKVRMDELTEQGIIHICPLDLREVA